MSEKLYRLTARAQMHGEVREAGYMFTLVDGERGPSRSVMASHHGAQIADHLRGGQELVDELLYEEVKEVDVRDAAPQEAVERLPSSDDLAVMLSAATERMAELEAQLRQAEHDMQAKDNEAAALAKASAERIAELEAQLAAVQTAAAPSSAEGVADAPAETVADPKPGKAKARLPDSPFAAPPEPRG